MSKYNYITDKKEIIKRVGNTKQFSRAYNLDAKKDLVICGNSVFNYDDFEDHGPELISRRKNCGYFYGIDRIYEAALKSKVYLYDDKQ